MHLPSVDWGHVGRIFSAGLTPTIAIYVAYIARQQWRTNQQQHRLALFEKRMAVFNGIRKYILTTLKQDRLELNLLFELWEEVQSHKFLFGADVATYIEEIYEKGGTLWATKQTLLTGGQENINKHTELLGWFSTIRLLLPLLRLLRSPPPTSLL